MDTLSTITILPSNKKEIDDYFNQAKAEILEGNQSPLLILRQLKAFELILKKLLTDNDLKYCFQNEAMKYEGMKFDAFGCNFQLKNSPAIFDYSECNDSEHKQLVQNLNLAKENLNAREKWLQKLDGQTSNEYGEIVNPPLKKQSEILAVTLK